MLAHLHGSYPLRRSHCLAAGRSAPDTHLCIHFTAAGITRFQILRSNPRVDPVRQTKHFRGLWSVLPQRVRQISENRRRLPSGNQKPSAGRSETRVSLGRTARTDETPVPPRHEGERTTHGVSATRNAARTFQHASTRSSGFLRTTNSARRPRTTRTQRTSRTLSTLSTPSTPSTLSTLSTPRTLDYSCPTPLQ